MLHTFPSSYLNLNDRIAETYTGLNAIGELGFADFANAWIYCTDQIAMYNY